jgi:hypothetical protein
MVSLNDEQEKTVALTLGAAVIGFTLALGLLRCVGVLP